MKYAEACEQFYKAENEFDEQVFATQPGFDWQRTTTDDYDSSIEFHGVPNNTRMTEALQKLCYDHGFAQCWLNHDDGWETHYAWPRDGGFKPSEGWRKRQWKRKLPDGSPDKEGKIEVEEFPASWPREWLESGYVTIVNPTRDSGNANG